ncbi:unnamed protein product [Orchesella dallaii]|uniref:Uncharacterized protein n=1 Tax=Orchesella dallaii TaxID=48710 RepID=A0ABP1S9W9_9HEXA
MSKVFCVVCPSQKYSQFSNPILLYYIHLILVLQYNYTRIQQFKVYPGSGVSEMEGSKSACPFVDPCSVSCWRFNIEHPPVHILFFLLNSTPMKGKAPDQTRPVVLTCSYKFIYIYQCSSSISTLFVSQDQDGREIYIVHK